MQLHEHSKSAPALAAPTRNGEGKRMRFDAVMHAELKMAENTEKRIKNRHSGCRFESASLWLLVAQCANNTGKATSGNNQQKNRRPRIFINER
ncbi:hypothetical protein [Escherichia coli]|nr:hypothetical protein [Escherichia coli]EIQ1086398.1 hypothetical protein [Escherichia coli]HBV0266763.1 hypothetical protein [Escherichia coli]